jgi:hypothetical protein
MIVKIRTNGKRFSESGRSGLYTLNVLLIDNCGRQAITKKNSFGILVPLRMFWSPSWLTRYSISWRDISRLYILLLARRHSGNN